MDTRNRPQALVVYESMFGSTRVIAHAIASGLEPDLETQVVEVGEAPVQLDPHLALLVVAAPTHAFGLSRVATRQSAATQTPEPLVSRGIGVREWLEGLEEVTPLRQPCAGAAVDTRLGKHWVPGSAARGIKTRLRRLGFTIAVPPESFWVRSSPGDLIVGEQERATELGARLAAQVVAEHEAALPTPPGRG